MWTFLKLDVWTIERTWVDKINEKPKNIESGVKELKREDFLGGSEYKARTCVPVRPGDSSGYAQWRWCLVISPVWDCYRLFGSVTLLISRITSVLIFYQLTKVIIFFGTDVPNRTDSPLSNKAQPDSIIQFKFL